MKRRHIWRAAIALLAAYFLVLGITVPVTAQDKPVVRIVTSRGIHAVGLWALGRFADKYDFRTDINIATTNAEMQRYLQTGAADVGLLGYASPAILAEQNVSNIKVISGLQLGGQNLVMRKNVELRSWKDLEGKRIGRPPGTYAAVLFALAAEVNNVDLGKVNMINTTAAGTAELLALRNGDFDGLVMFSPVPDRAVVEGFAYYPSCCDIGSTSKFGSFNQIIGANTEFLKNRQLTMSFLKAFAEAQEEFQRNNEMAIELMHQFSGVSKEILVEARKHATLEIRVNIQTAINVAQQGPKFGFTKVDNSAAVSRYFDLRYLSEATGRSVAELSQFQH